MFKKKYSLGPKKTNFVKGNSILFGSKGYWILLNYHLLKISVTGFRENQSTISSFRAHNSGWRKKDGQI